MSDIDMSKIFVSDDEVQPQQVPVVEEAAPLPTGGNIIELPSNGAFGYPSFVEFRDIMVKDEEVLANTTTKNYSRVLNGVLKSLVKDCEFYERMCVHDRDYILLWVWSLNYTPTKPLDVTCEHCKTKTRHTIDMTKLPFTSVKSDLTIPFKVPVKSTGGHVLLRLTTVADELFAEEYLEKNPTARYESVILARSIDVGVNMPFEAKLKWISESISSREMGFIRKFHQMFAYGLETELKLECPACREVTHGELPFQAEDILFPVVSDDLEELVRLNKGA